MNKKELIFWYNNIMNKKELKEKAKKIARIEMESRNKDNNLEEIYSKIENIIGSLSIEELFQLDEYIRQELKCF